jgi:hypothetical protein
MSNREHAEGSSARAILQQRLQGANMGAIRFVFEVPHDPKLRACSAVLGCAACSEVLSYDPNARCWTCNSCKCVVDSSTFLALAKRVQITIKSLVLDAESRRGKRRWSLAGLLSRNRQS